MKTLAQRAHKKGLELACHIAPDVPDILVGDPDRLRQIIVNLVGNALKFTDQGEVVVRSPEEAEVPSGNGATRTRSCVRFAVRDTGIGIPLHKQEVIFQAFGKADSSTTRRYGGTGLGLAISSRLVALMGGRDRGRKRARARAAPFTSRPASASGTWLPGQIPPALRPAA